MMTTRWQLVSVWEKALFFSASQSSSVALCLHFGLMKTERRLIRYGKLYLNRKNFHAKVEVMSAARGFRRGERSPRSSRRKRLNPSSLFTEERFGRGFSVPSTCEVDDFCIYDINYTENEGIRTNLG